MLEIIYNTYKTFILKLLELFFPTNKKVEGEMSVNGCGFLEFKFEEYPENISVYFTDDVCPSNCNPCDPGKEDKLFWHVDKVCDEYVLYIHWEVVSCRNIKWKLCM